MLRLLPMLLLLMILMLTPLSFGYLYAWLLYPMTVVVYRLIAKPDTQIMAWAVAAVALLSLTIPMPRGAQTYGNTFFATLLLFVGLAVELWRIKKIPTQSDARGELISRAILP